VSTTKITLVGAGSASFGLSTLQDIIACADALRGSTVALADINSESLELSAPISSLKERPTCALRWMAPSS
jgi:alpha-galactosidase/6-phospho-beta-glucosidase family protein